MSFVQRRVIRANAGRLLIKSGYVIVVNTYCKMAEIGVRDCLLFLCLEPLVYVVKSICLQCKFALFNYCHFERL